MAPILWYSKKQNTAEIPTFGSEFVALKIATKSIDGLKYKLRMFGVSLNGPSRIFCDSESVVITGIHPDSSLKKKHCSVAYHRVREAVAAGKQLIFYERSGTNLADLLKKLLSHIKILPLIEAIVS